MAKMKLIRPTTILDANLLASNVAESDYANYALTTTYSLGALVSVIDTNIHQVWESIQSVNIGHAPTGGSGDLWWVYVGSTDRWNMFDKSITSQTTNPDLIYVKVKPSSRIDSLALLNINASSVRIKMTDPIDGVVYDKTTILYSTAGIVSWYSYFFTAISRKKDFIASDLPPYSTASIEIWLSDPDNTVAIGALVLGLSRDIGYVTYGAKVGIQDYSIKTKDTFGNYSIVERAFNKYADLSLEIDNTFIDEFQVIMAAYRATPIVYFGSDTYNSLDIYGFYKDFSVVVDKPTASICALTIEGLT